MLKLAFTYVLTIGASSLFKSTVAEAGICVRTSDSQSIIRMRLVSDESRRELSARFNRTLVTALSASDCNQAN